MSRPNKRAKEMEAPAPATAAEAAARLVTTVLDLEWYDIEQHCRPEVREQLDELQRAMTLERGGNPDAENDLESPTYVAFRLGMEIGRRLGAGGAR